MLTALLLVPPIFAAPLPEKAKAKEPKVYTLIYIGAYLLPKQSIEQQKSNYLKGFQKGAFFTAPGAEICIKEKAFDFLKTKDVKTVQEWVRKHLKVESLGGTRVFRLSIEDAPLKSRAVILNAISDEFDRRGERGRKPGQKNSPIGYVIERAENP
jgi:hypothetical protein